MKQATLNVKARRPMKKKIEIIALNGDTIILNWNATFTQVQQDVQKYFGYELPCMSIVGEYVIKNEEDLREYKDQHKVNPGNMVLSFEIITLHSPQQSQNCERKCPGRPPRPSKATGASSHNSPATSLTFDSDSEDSDSED